MAITPTTMKIEAAVLIRIGDGEPIEVGTTTIELPVHIGTDDNPQG